MTIQTYDWVSKDTKLNTNGWSVPLSTALKAHSISPENLISSLQEHRTLWFIVWT